YTAAKAGVAAMTVTWAKELARYGIRAAGIAPGFCETRMVSAMPSDIQDRITATIPARRFGRPDEIAYAARFILEDDYFNGRILEVDGGLRL
ncbi:MAG: SDR family oxidoreductase, partial [Pseudomonadota bacterium]